jgi:hypothetical protein
MYQIDSSQMQIRPAAAMTNGVKACHFGAARISAATVCLAANMVSE